MAVLYVGVAVFVLMVCISIYLSHLDAKAEASDEALRWETERHRIAA